MTLDEQLSALLDGDLPPHEADALHARIATDPDLAERWEQLCAMVADLDQLALPQVDEALVARAARGVAPRSRTRPAIWALAAAAAGLLVGLAVPRAAVTVWVEPGWVRIEGPATLAVDGREETVRGTAHIPRTTGAPITVGARPEPVPDGPPARDLAALDAELERATRRAQRLEDELSVLRSRVVAHEGRAVPWPSGLPALLEPDAFDAAVRKLLVDYPEIELLAVDCSEFPCAAVLYERQAREADRDWRAVFYPLTDRLPEPWVAEPIVRDTERDDSRHQVAVVGIVTPEFAEQHEQRVIFRVRQLIELFQPEVMRE